MNNDDLSFDDEDRIHRSMKLAEEFFVDKERTLNGRRPDGLPQWEDFVQETMSKAIRAFKVPREDPIEDDDAFVYTMMTNLFAEEIRKKRWICLLDPQDHLSWPTEPEAIHRHSNFEIAEELLDGMRHLTEIEWLLARVFWGNQLHIDSNEDRALVGSLLDMKPNTVAQIIHRMGEATKRRTSTRFRADEIIHDLEGNDEETSQAMTIFAMMSGGGFKWKNKREFVEAFVGKCPKRSSQGRQKDGNALRRLYWKCVYMALSAHHSVSPRAGRHAYKARLISRALDVKPYRKLALMGSVHFMSVNKLLTKRINPNTSIYDEFIDQYQSELSLVCGRNEAARIVASYATVAKESWNSKLSSAMTR